ncbi:cytochrome c oxidase subunit 2 [Virgibacillus natechei]|uniref:Cytochrome c oxidase subunit 2 n=1 Tax=Virgibacillus natechei TaxID=1216297 RepID=A0ABS4IC13_9BACI|nr:cytochrome C oxidase subunit II [Virgibacillus natechei]MBP1968477.1 cytochrome c oxidase subunit 2 [Virgibacillus natechei]UZD13595.1 cytochrome C oxidase subunit II [Virgibacillus natechei]
MKKSLLATLFLGLVLILAACGGGDSSEPASGEDAGAGDAANEVNITATNFDLGEDVTVPAGEEISLTLTNEEGMHGISIDELDVHLDGEGETTFTADEPGKYTIYCNIPCGEGHDDMVTTLIVE